MKLFLAAILAALTLGAGETPPSTTCTQTVSPGQSLQAAINSTPPGGTLCIHNGTYGSTTTWTHITGSNIHVQGYPGESNVVLKGFIEIDGSNVDLAYVDIDESNTLYLPPSGGSHQIDCGSAPATASLSINGPGDIVEHDNIYQSDPATRAVGIGIGWGGTADNAVVRYDFIHDVGGCAALDHIIYASHGDGIQIYGNWLWGDPHGWGVQLYPNPTNARVWANVIDHTGAGFVVGSESAGATHGNQIFDNVIQNTTGLPGAGLSQGVAISDYWGSTPGTGNSFTGNDSFQNPGGLSVAQHITVGANISKDPLFENPAQHDYRLLPASPVASYGLWNPTP